MKTRMLVTAMAAALLGGTGCDLVRDPTAVMVGDRFLGVHGVLVAGADEASVLVTWTRPPTGPGSLRVEPAPGAEVWLVDEAAGDSVRLVNTGGTPCLVAEPFGGTFGGGPSFAAGCYRGVVPGGIRVGGAYRLRLAVEGESVTGGTTVPLPPTVHSSRAGDTLHLARYDGGAGQEVPDSVPVRWEDPNAGSYAELRFVPARPECWSSIMEVGDDAGTNLLVFTKGDSATVTSNTLDCSEGGPVEAVDLQVTVADVNYATYVQDTRERRGDSTPGPSAAAGLAGAYGVFGAVAYSNVRVFFRHGGP